MQGSETGRDTRAPDNPPDSENPLFWEPSLAYLKITCGTLLVGTLLFMLVVRIMAPDQLLRLAATSFIALVALVAWILVVRNRLQAAIYVLVFGVWVGLTMIALLFGGVRAPSVYAYPISLILLGWLVGTRAAMIMAALSVTLVVGFALGEANGILPRQPPTPAIFHAVVQVVVIILATVLIIFLVRAYQNRNTELRALSTTLSSRTAELEARTRDLQRAQAVAKTGSWIADYVSGTVYLSDEACRIFGVPEGTPGNFAKFLSRVDPADQHLAESARETALKSGSGLAPHELRLLVRGKTRWILQTAEHELGPDGKLLRAVGTVQDITERKAAEAALQESEQRYRTLLEWTPEAVAVHSEGLVIYVNPAAVNMMGATSAQELIGRKIIDSVHPDYRKLVLARMKQAGEEEKATPVIEEKFIKLDGTAVDVEVQTTPIVYDGKRAVHVAMRDITARKQAERALRISEELFSKAFQASPMLVSITTLAEGRYLNVNEAFLHLLGYSREDVVGKTSADIGIWKTPEDRRRAIDGLSEGHSGAGTEVELRKKSGATVFCEVRGAPIDVDGIPCLIMVTNDITERKLAQSALRASEEKFAKAFQSSPLFVSISTRAEGRYIDVNDAFLRVLGHAREDVVGKTSREIGLWMNPADRQRAIDTLNAGESVKGLEATFRNKAGESIVCEIWGDPIEIDGTSCVIWVTIDVTERKAVEAARASLETQLRESQKMEAIGTLAGGIAHDFNNIIATILGNAELARQDAGANAPVLESLEEIRKSGTRARDLVQQILSFSRREPTLRKPLALTPLLQESARLLRATLPARVTLEVHCDAQVPAVLADATQIQQVLINLTTNAMQAMRGRPGHIALHLDSVMLDAAMAEAQPALRDLHARHPGATVRLAVRDDGEGMDADTLGRVFEPFFTTKPVGEGTGLGLSVVLGIVQSHEGAITVHSMPGAGTTFTVYLPPALASAGPLAQAPLTGPAIASPPPRGSRHILYLDDDASLVFLVKRLLERHGFRVSAFSSQVSALEALRKDAAAYDLVLTDYNMPGLSGLDVAREVRSIRPDLPVVVASGFIDDGLRSQAAGAGVRDLLFKPTAVEDFCRAIEALLDPPPP